MISVSRVFDRMAADIISAGKENAVKQNDL